jgi:hypothetical protein
MTRAELMRHALTQALRRVHIGPKKLKLDEETRWQIAGEAVGGAAPTRAAGRSDSVRVKDPIKKSLFCEPNQRSSSHSVLGCDIASKEWNQPNARDNHFSCHHRGLGLPNRGP